MGIHFFHIITIIGALGFFIYGMKIMSEGIQKVAGTKLRLFLNKMTSNTGSSIFTGFLTTSIIQSSSATTVMIVSFVNAGLLSLRQAIGVIMGANIGTTMTAWMIAFIGFQFKISEYALPVLGIGVPLLFVKKERIKFLGEFLTGFALLFIGLDSLKHAFEIIHLKDNPQFLAFMIDFSEINLQTTLFFVLIGALLTIVVQSSSAAMALTLTLIDSGLPLHLAAAIVLGENIGTTVTANLAAIVANTHAKRAARAHFIFNVFGAIWMLFVFDRFIFGVKDLIENWAPQYLKIDSEKDIIRYSLAFFHTSFNIINTLLLSSFVPLIEKTVSRLLPINKQDAEDDFHLTYFSSGLFNATELGLLEAEKALEKFAEITKKMLQNIEKILQATDTAQVEKYYQRIQKQEMVTDTFEEELVTYLTRLSSAGSLSGSNSSEVRSMLNISYDLERIGDLCVNIGAEIKGRGFQMLSSDQKQELLGTLGVLFAANELLLQQLVEKGKNQEYSEKIQKYCKDVEKRQKNQKMTYSEKIQKDSQLHIGAEIIFNNIFYFLQRISNHILNISEDLSGKYDF